MSNLHGSTEERRSFSAKTPNGALPAGVLPVDLPGEGAAFHRGAGSSGESGEVGAQAGNGRGDAERGRRSAEGRKLSGGLTDTENDRIGPLSAGRAGVTNRPPPCLPFPSPTCCRT